MKKVSLIVVGKLKDKHLEAIEKDYLQRINSFKLQIIECKASADDQDREGKEVAKKLDDLKKDGPIELILMSEFGKQKESPDFSKYVFNFLESSRHPVFLIAGAMGHSEQIKSLKHQSLSLGAMTFPHKIARILLVEQLYRAQTIKTNHPYHN